MKLTTTPWWVIAPMVALALMMIPPPAPAAKTNYKRFGGSMRWNPVRWTREQYIERTGHEPQNDDLDRVNCPVAGEPGHYYCGLCSHGLPKFLCLREHKGGEA